MKVFPFSVLFDTAQGPVKYTLKAFLISVIPAFILSMIISAVGSEFESPDLPTDPKQLFLNAVILAPILETFLLWFGITVISKFIKDTLWIALISGLIWAILHSLVAPLWGITIFWSFVVFSIAFIRWKNVSISHAIGVAVAIHMCQNLTAVVLIILFS